MENLKEKQIQETKQQKQRQVDKAIQRLETTRKLYMIIKLLELGK